MSVNTQYLKSCFLSLIVTLVYVAVALKGFKLEPEPSFLITSTIFVFMSGLIAPLAFTLKDKIVTDEIENARPDDAPIDLPKNLKTSLSNQVNTNKPQNSSEPPQKTYFSFIPMPDDESAVCDIFIGNIPFALNEFELKKILFGVSKNICSIKIPKDPKTKKRKNFAFVRVLSTEKDSFISGLNGREVKGRKLSVKEANNRTISA